MKEEEVVCEVLQVSLAAMLCYQSPKESYQTFWSSSIGL